MVQKSGKTASLVAILLGAIIITEGAHLACGPSRDAAREREPAGASQARAIPGDEPPSNKFVFVGVPRGRPELKVLENRAFAVGYDEARKCPAWVAYRLPGDVKFTTHKRLGFTIDTRTDARVSDGFYTNSGFSRGHMAASYTIYSRFGPEAQRETYLMSNICPQDQGMNNGRWQELEVLEGGDSLGDACWAKACGEVWVTIGPTFDEDDTRIPSGVAIPDSCFRIILDEEPAEGVRVLSFIMPNRNARAPLESFLVSVDQVEQKTGLDFFWEMDDAAEDRVEAEKPTTLWPSK